MASPVQPRGGHTAFPNELLALMLGELTAEQFRIFVGLLYLAQFKREGSTTPDGRWRVGFGQVLVSYASLAERFGVSVHVVERALRRLKALGIEVRRASPAATPPATSSETSAATPAATPPTLVDFGKWAAFLGGANVPATPAATPPTTPAATQPETIQHRNTGTPKTEKLPSPSAPGSRRRRSGEADPRHRPLLHRLETAFLELRGVRYGFRGGRDAQAISELLRLSSGDVDEVEARWRAALALRTFPACSTFGQLGERWNDLAAHVRRAPSDPLRAAVATAEGEWAKVLRFVDEHTTGRASRLREDLAQVEGSVRGDVVEIRTADACQAERFRSLHRPAIVEALKRVGLQVNEVRVLEVQLAGGHPGVAAGAR